MQVLGDLVRLPATNDLPLPWWHRAPLGLQSRTSCYVALVRSSSRPVPDVIVSVIDPCQYDRLVRVSALQPDRPGLISQVLSAVSELNIALAECVTLETEEHDVTLVCEPAHRDAGVPSAAAIEARLIAHGVEAAKIRRYKARPILWRQRGSVEAGWIRDIDWRSKISKGARDGSLAKVDLSKAVVSADTTNRLLRFVFPLRGAKTIRVEHTDQPGVLARVMRLLEEHEINVLSMLLRRGGARPGSAVIVAACEPMARAGDDASYTCLTHALDNLPPDLGIDYRLDDGIDCRATITPKEPPDVIAKVPELLVEKVRLIKRTVPKGKPAVFFSRRFVTDESADAYAAEAREALVANGCHVLEVNPKKYVLEPNMIFIEVSAHLWAADAGLILVTGIGKEDPLGRNIPHEFGFLQGQSKPTLMLLQDGAPWACGWTNIDGVYAPRFATGAAAFTKENPRSIWAMVQGFVKGLRNEHVPCGC